jgi:hypothetical protein
MAVSRAPTSARPDHQAEPGRGACTGPGEPEVDRDRPQPALGWPRDLHAHGPKLALPGVRHRRLLPDDHGLVDGLTPLRLIWSSTRSPWPCIAAAGSSSASSITATSPTPLTSSSGSCVADGALASIGRRRGLQHQRPRGERHRDLGVRAFRPAAQRPVQLPTPSQVRGVQLARDFLARPAGRHSANGQISLAAFARRFQASPAWP